MRSKHPCEAAVHSPLQCIQELRSLQHFVPSTLSQGRDSTYLGPGNCVDQSWAAISGRMLCAHYNLPKMAAWQVP